MMALRQLLNNRPRLGIYRTGVGQETLSYQGNLTDAARQPVNASLSHGL